MEKVSVIIPVHNAARYVEATVLSIVSQSHEDIEVILVDDGSTDGSGELIDALAASRKNFKVFHKPCGGVSSARNMALDNLDPDSKYVMFVDSDDKLPSESLCQLVSAMESTPGSSMALGAIGLFGPGIESDIIPCPKDVMTPRESLHDFLHAKYRKSQKYLCNRMFRTSELRELRFDENIHYKEDGLLIVQYLLTCNGPVVYIDNLVYLYRQIPTSAMGSLGAGWNPRIMTNLDAHGRILDELRAHRAGRRLILTEIHNTFRCRRWILRRVIGRRAGRRKASFTTLFRVARPVLTSLF